MKEASRVAEETAGKSVIKFQVYQETIPPPRLLTSGRIFVMSSKEFSTSFVLLTFSLFMEYVENCEFSTSFSTLC